jgi:hypothetical protein
MDKGTAGIYLEILRVDEYVIDTTSFILKIRPESNIKYRKVSTYFAIVIGQAILRKESA